MSAHECSRLQRRNRHSNDEDSPSTRNAGYAPDQQLPLRSGRRRQQVPPISRRRRRQNSDAGQRERSRSPIRGNHAENRPEPENPRRAPVGNQQQEEPRVCCICLEYLEEGEGTTRLSCSHFFHSACITTWLQSNSVCPLCRAMIPQPGRDPNVELMDHYEAMVPGYGMLTIRGPASFFAQNPSLTFTLTNGEPHLSIIFPPQP